MLQRKASAKYARRVARVWALSQPKRPTWQVAKGMLKVYRRVKREELARIAA
jgi:hypothetical protein